LVSGSISAASANFTALQNAVSSQGTINVTQAGTFYINASVIVSSNTTIVLGPNTTIILAPNSNVPLVMTYSLVNFLNNGTTLSGGTAVTLTTSGSESAVNVQWASHGQVVGNCVWLAGNSVTTYNNCFRVAAITDANNFTVYTNHYSSTAPGTGSRGIQAVQNVNLIGGTWDYNQANQSGSGYGLTAIILGGIADSTLDSVKTQNGSRAGIQLQGFQNINATNTQFYEPTAAALNVYGPGSGLKVDGISGVSQNPLVTLDTNLNSSPYQFSAPGDLFDISIYNVTGICLSGSAISVSPSDNEIMDAINIDQTNMTGVATQSVNVARGAGFTTGQIGRLYLRNTQSPVNTSSEPIFNIGACAIAQLTIADSTFVPGSTVSAEGNNFMTLGSGATISQLIVDKFNVNNFPSTSGTVILFYINNAQIKNITVRDMQALNGTGNLHLLAFYNAANTVQSILFDGGAFDSSVSDFVYFATLMSSGTPNIIVRGANINGATSVIHSSVAQNYHSRFIGNSMSVGTGVLLTAASNTIKLSSDGTNDLTSGPWIAVSAGTPIISLFGNDITFDVSSTYVATTAGQYCTSTTTGTGKAGLAVKVNGSSTNTWYALATGTSGVNTLIV